MILRSLTTGEAVTVEEGPSRPSTCRLCGASSVRQPFHEDMPWWGIPLWSSSYRGEGGKYVLWGSFCCAAHAHTAFRTELMYTRIPLVSWLALLDLTLHVHGPEFMLEGANISDGQGLISAQPLPLLELGTRKRCAEGMQQHAGLWRYHVGPESGRAR